MVSETERRSFVSLGNEGQDFFSTLLVLLGHKNCRINNIEAIDLNVYSIE
jgi:hypothetical protein